MSVSPPCMWSSLPAHCLCPDCSFLASIAASATVLLLATTAQHSSPSLKPFSNSSEATAHELADLEHCGTALLRQPSRRIIEEKHRAECAAFRPRLNALRKTLLTNRLGSVDEPIVKLRSSAPPKHRKRAQERAPAPFRPFHSQVGPKVYPGV